MNPYEILQVKPGASPAEIQQAYRDLVRVWHPDRFAHDARLQKVAEEKLRQINDAFQALENGSYRPSKYPSENRGSKTEEAPPEPPFRAAREAAARFGQTRAPRAAPSSFPLRPIVFLALAAASLFGIARVFLFFTEPMRQLEFISADARRVASLNGPKLTDAFAGWNGNLPEGLGELMRFYNTTAPVGATFDPPRLRKPTTRTTIRSAPPVAPGIGEIQVHNHTDERAMATLTSKNNFAPRRFWVPGRGEAVFNALGPAVYFVDVNFPDSRRPPLRIGPFVLIETQAADATQGDRYEITLTPPH